MQLKVNNIAKELTTGHKVIQCFTYVNYAAFGSRVQDILWLNRYITYNYKSWYTKDRDAE